MVVDILPALKVRGFQSIQTTQAEWIPGGLMLHQMLLVE